MNRISNITIYLVFFFIWVIGWVLPAMADAAVIRVKTDGNDSKSGESWSLAKRSVQGAIDAARANDEIWVAAGVYEEHLSNKVIDGASVDVALYGGFAGTETARDQRDWETNFSILDGTADGAVVRITSFAGPGMRVDGFVIRNGRAAPLDPSDPGGGIRIVISAPVITHNTIRQNISSGYGAGIAVEGFNVINGESPWIEDNVIVENYASDLIGDGAGIAVVNSSPSIVCNVIARNQAAQNGGGIACWKNASPTIAGNFIISNAACLLESTEDGSGAGRPSVGGGGIFASATDFDGTPIPEAVCDPLIHDNVIAANGGYLGGGICAIDSIIEGATIVNNTIVANNGSGIFWQNTSPRIHNNIIAHNTWGLEQIENAFTHPVFNGNCIYANSLKDEATDVKGLSSPVGVNGNISADPQFANTHIGDYHIQPTSPCRATGSSDMVDPAWCDIDGQARIDGEMVDIGADASDGTLWQVPTPVIHVSPYGNDLADGSSWADAKRTVDGGIEAALIGGGEVWVVAGIYGETIQLPAYVYLYGGFSGVETSFDQRDVTTNVSILDGSGGYGVITCTTGGYGVCTVDGFTIRNGCKNTFGGGDFGGGIWCRVTGPLIANNQIVDNLVGAFLSSDLAHGGGVACYLSYASIAGNTFVNNQVLNAFDGSGGGIYSTRSMPFIRENIFMENQAKRGSAIYCFGSEPRILDNWIQANQLLMTGPPYFGSSLGAVALQACRTFRVENNVVADNVAAIGAGISTESCFAGQIDNNLVVNNTAYDYSGGSGLGGGIYCEAQSGIDENIVIVNNTIVGNAAIGYFEQGGGLAIAVPPPLPLTDPVPPAMLTIANNIVAFNSSGIFQLLTTPMLVPDLDCNDVFNTAGNYINLNAGATDISQDPQFYDPDGVDNDTTTTADNDYHLTTNSPCIDSGNSRYWTLAETDFEGDARLLDGNGDGIDTVDIGADEYNVPCHGDHDTDGDVDGSDLVAQIAVSGTVTLRDFAAGFGRKDCPL